MKTETTATATATLSANRKDAFRLLPGEVAPKPNTVIAAIVYSARALSKDGKEPTREEVIEKTLAEYTPPRSRAYNREYLVGYISYGIGKGFLIEREPTGEEPEKVEAAPAKKAPAKKAPAKKASPRAAGEPRRKRSANAK